MKAFIAAVMLFSMNISIASAVNVKITDAKFDAVSGEISIGVGVVGTCSSKISYRVRGCTDLVVPYTCFIDVNAEGGEACDGTSFSLETVSLEELNLRNRELSYGTLVIQNNKGKSRKYISLPVIK